MDDNAKLETVEWKCEETGLRMRKVTFKGREFEVREDGKAWYCGWVSARGFNMPRKLVKFCNSQRYMVVRFSISSGEYVRSAQHEIVAHAFIGERPKGLDIDHIDGNPSNNNLSNLRYLTHAENNRAFARGKRGATSKYRGVCWYLAGSKWVAKAHLPGGKQIQVGSFDDEQDAARAFDEFAAKNGYDEQALNRTHHSELN